MRAIRELPLAASLLLTGLALFFGEGPRYGSLPWLGGGVLAVIVVLIATLGIPAGWQRLVPLAALTVWLALSITWSALPDRSWEYANRAFVYLLFAALGLWLAGRTRDFALGVAALLGAVVTWSLLGKVLPFVYDDYGRIARLRGPVGLWNQLALLADFALPLALWRRGRSGTLLAYAWIVALLLTYSRGGLLTAIVVLAAWFALTDERAQGAAVLLVAALPAAAVVGIAFLLPGVTSDGQSSHVRWRDGLIFGALLVAGALVAALVPRPRLSPLALKRLAIAGAVAVVVGALAVLVLRGGSGSIGNSGGRLGSTSSNFRTVWWRQALDGWQHNALAGTGAGSFHVTNLRYRTTFLDETTEPHDLPLQFLSETGIVGLALLAVALALLLHTGRRRGHELALSLLLPAYVVHTLVDIDWDFVAVSAPAFVAAGALAGRPVLRPVPAFAGLVAAGAALLAFVVLLLPWLGQRWADEATFAAPARAETLAKRARSVDPLLVEPLWALAFAEEQRGNDPRSLAYYEQATREQPENAQTWLAAGRFALHIGCARRALQHFYRFVALDNKARPSEGADDYREALRLVNTGKPRC